jgi:hypothetical protein
MMMMMMMMIMVMMISDQGWRSYAANVILTMAIKVI